LLQEQKKGFATSCGCATSHFLLAQLEWSFNSLIWSVLSLSISKNLIVRRLILSYLRILKWRDNDVCAGFLLFSCLGTSVACVAFSHLAWNYDLIHWILFNRTPFERITPISTFLIPIIHSLTHSLTHSSYTYILLLSFPPSYMFVSLFKMRMNILNTVYYMFYIGNIQVREDCVDIWWSTLHPLWYIPLCFAVLYCDYPLIGLQFNCWKYTIIINLIVAILTRIWFIFDNSVAYYPNISILLLFFVLYLYT
jgi:hypothetical protein